MQWPSASFSTPSTLVFQHPQEFFNTLYLVTETGPERILITDHTCETDNDDSTLRTMKFTYRKEGGRKGRLTMDGSWLEPGLPSTERIFTREFTAQFQ